jgi:hypothetical protein
MSKSNFTHKFVRGRHLFVIATLLAGLVFSLVPAHAATITVTASSSDVLDANGGNCATMTIGDLPGPNGETSLREAICAANNTAGADTITLPAGTYTLAITGASEHSNAKGDLDLRSDITINGAGAGSSTINANQIDRVLQVHSGATVELNGVTLTDGKSPNDFGEHCSGGGVHNEGTLTIRDSTVSGNATGNNRGCSGCYGGGVYNEGTLTIENSTISGNTTGDAGAAGSPGGDGGGVYILDGTLTIRESTISNNTTGDGSGSARDGYGGGVYVHTGAVTVTIENSTISGNAAKGGGGGVCNRSTLTLVNCTITDNTADADNDCVSEHGGGIRYARTGSMMNAKNTIVAGNHENGTIHYYDCYGSSNLYTSQGYNLVGSTECPHDGTGDQTTSDPKLGPLQDNGGPTFTHELLSGSPAIDAIPEGGNGYNGAPATDQRGEPTLPFRG